MGVLDFGTRMTVVKLGDGALWLHSPVPLDESLRAELDAIGPVRHVVAPNLFHHLFAGDVRSHYPAAELTVAKGLPRKRSDLVVHYELGRSEPPWSNEIACLQLVGSPTGEWVFFHAASNTLICSDLVQHMCKSKGGLTGVYLKLSGIHDEPGLSGILRLGYKRNDASRAAMRDVLARPFERIIPCHGHAIVDEPHEALRRTYRWLGLAGGRP